MVCENGLVVSTQEFENVKMRHMGYTFEELQERIKEMVERLPLTVESLNKMKQKQVEEKVAIKFAKKALTTRFTEDQIKIFKIDFKELIKPIRKEDEGSDLWSVFNVVQEKIITGDFTYLSGGKERKARQIKNFNQDLKVNKELFEMFKKRYPKYKKVDNKLLKTIIKKFNTTVYQTVIDKRDGVQLPETIGWLFIGTCQQSKKQNIDYAKSNKYGMAVSNKNWETDGKLAKIFFSSYAPKHKMRNKEFWGFTASREFKRSVAKTYPENWNIYVVVDATTKLRLTYQKSMQKDFVLKKQKEALEKYNEFDL
jgi:hypothetical protein